ncbi:MAG: hypothetical protein ACFE0I_01130 [Elainellaceae cyanobacterium]
MVRYVRLPNRYSIAGSLISLAVFWGQCSLAAGLMSLVSVVPALAPESEMTQAAIRNLRNDVQLLPFEKTVRPAKIDDIVRPLDAVQTGKSSMAELLFNQGTLLRIGSSSLFRFAPRKQPINMDASGIRASIDLHMQDGIALITVPPTPTPDAETVQIDMPGSQIQVLPAAIAPDSSKPEDQSEKVLAMHDAGLKADYVIALSDGEITVTDADGKNAVAVPVGHLVTVVNGSVQPPQPVDPVKFVQTSKHPEFPIEDALSAPADLPVSVNPAANDVTEPPISVTGLIESPKESVNLSPVFEPSLYKSPKPSQSIDSLGSVEELPNELPTDSAPSAPPDDRPKLDTLLSPDNPKDNPFEPSLWAPNVNPPIKDGETSNTFPYQPLFAPPKAPNGAPKIGFLPPDSFRKPNSWDFSSPDSLNPPMSSSNPLPAKPDLLPGFDNEWDSDPAESIPEPSTQWGLLAGALGWAGYRLWRSLQRRL